MLDARITSGTRGRPSRGLCSRSTCSTTRPTPPTGFDLADVGLQFFLPLSRAGRFRRHRPGAIRGDNLCAWETGLRRPLRDGEIVIDPDIGRVLFGVGTAAQRDALVTPQGTGFVSRIYASFTYGAAGPVGAHPVTRSVPATTGAVDLRKVERAAGRHLAAERSSTTWRTPRSRSSSRSATALCTASIFRRCPGTVIDGGSSLRLAQSLTIRAIEGERPIVLLAQPLAFRPVTASAATADFPVVRLEGLFLARDPAGFPAGDALIARAAVARLEMIGCTLDPGGHALRDGTRAPLAPGDAPRKRLRLCAGRRSKRVRADAGHRHPALDHRGAGDRRPLPSRHQGRHRRCRSRRRRSADRRFRDRRRDRSGQRLGRAARLPRRDLFRTGAGVRGRRRGRHLHAALRSARQPARLHQAELVLRRRRPAAAESFLRAGARRAGRVHVRVVQRSGLRAARAARPTAACARLGPTTTRWAPSASCSMRTSGPTCT